MTRIYVATKYENDSPELEEWGDTYVGLNLREAVNSLNNICVVPTRLTDAEVEYYTSFDPDWSYPGKCYCGSSHMRATISFWEDGKHLYTIRLYSDSSGTFHNPPLLSKELP